MLVYIPEAVIPNDSGMKRRPKRTSLNQKKTLYLNVDEVRKVMIMIERICTTDSVVLNIILSAHPYGKQE